MQELIIEVNKIEELQTIGNRPGLEKIFARAKSTIVNGENVILVRKEKDGTVNKFETFTTLEDLSVYTERVLKYL